jgi:hypothetical protein
MKWRLFFCFAILALGFSLGWEAVQAGSQPGSISEAEYWQLVAESKALAEQGSGENTAFQLEQLAARWEKIDLVQTENGAVIRLDGSIWAALMRVDAPDLAGLRIRLETLEREREIIKLAGLPSRSPGVLQEILARPEYQWKTQTPSWLQLLWDRFVEWLFDLLGQPEEIVISTDDGGFDLMTVLAFALVAGILAYILNRLFSDFVSEAALEANGHHEEPLSARTALNRADTLSKEGEYRSAVRYLYLSALLILDERGLLYYDRTKTNREYLRNLAGNARSAELLREVINVFDRVWYGFQPVDEETYQRYAAQVRELENLQ